MNWTFSLPKILLSIGIVLTAALGYWFYWSRNTRGFKRYFSLSYQETYQMDQLYPIILTGQIDTKVDYYRLPHGEVEASVEKYALKGAIYNNGFTLQLIRPRDRKKALRLIRSQYYHLAAPYLKEVNQLKHETIELSKLSKAQTKKLEKIACNTCKKRLQCQIAFTGCQYEREEVDPLLAKGIKVDNITTKHTSSNNGGPIS